MKEAVIFIGGFGARHQNYYLETFLVPGLLTQIEDIDIKLAPEDIKIPGQAGKRFFCQIEDQQKTIDIYEVYWDDLVDRVSAKDIEQKLRRGLGIIFYWASQGWNIMRISLLFCFQVIFSWLLILIWYFGVVVLVLAAFDNHQDLTSLPPLIEESLNPIISWADGPGMQLWLAISALLSFLPLSANGMIDCTDFTAHYLRDESVKGKPPIRALFRNRIKQAVDNVNSEGSYEQITILAHSLGGLAAVDFLGDYRNQHSRSFRLVTWGSPLKIAAAVTRWMKPEIVKCLDNPYVEQWDDFYSRQDWLCSEAPDLSGQARSKLYSKPVSFKISLLKQLNGYSHYEYFFDPKVLRQLILGRYTPEAL